MPVYVTTERRVQVYTVKVKMGSIRAMVAFSTRVEVSI